MRSDPQKYRRGMPRGSWTLYLMLIPGLLWILCFRLMPLAGIQIAFRDYNLFTGGGPWVGLKYFRQMFTRPQFLRVIRNTFEIGLIKLVVLFPLSILLALILNEIACKWFRRMSMTVLYLPHFLSYVVIHGLFVGFLAVRGGPVNAVITALGASAVNFYTNRWFRLVLVLTEGYKDLGWNTLLYLAALTRLDPERFEAAQIDGANRLQQIIYITLPELIPVTLLTLTLWLGNMVTSSTEQILAMYNPSVYETADVIGSFVYREGLGGGKYSLSVAAGLLESLTAFAFVMGAHFCMKRFFRKGLW